MVAEPVEAPVTESQEVTPSAAEQSPPSDDGLKTTSQLAESAEPAAEGEKPAQEAVRTEATPAKSAQEDYSDLQGRFDQGTALTTEESTRLGRYQQSIRDQQRAQQQAQETARQNRERVASLKNELHGRIQDTVTKRLGLDATGIDAPHVELIGKDVQEELDRVMGEIEPIALLPHQSAILSAIYNLYGQTQRAAEHVQDLQAKSFVEIVSAYGDARAYAASQTSDTAKKATSLSEENAKLKLQIEQLKASDGSGPGTNGRESSGGTSYTLAQLDAMPTNEWLALGDHETRQRILDAARAKARR